MALLSSLYGYPVLFAKRKSRGDLDLGVDYRTLNANTVTDACLLPCIHDLLS